MSDGHEPGELRWTDLGDVGRGAFCTCWTRGDRIVRHDRVVPTNGP